MAHIAQIRTEEEAEKTNWPCYWCEHGEIGRNPPKSCSVCRKQEHDTKPTEFKVAKTPR